MCNNLFTFTPKVHTVIVCTLGVNVNKLLHIDIHLSYTLIVYTSGVNVNKIELFLQSN